MIAIQKGLFAPDESQSKREMQPLVKAEVVPPAKTKVDSIKEITMSKELRVMNENMCVRQISNMTNPEEERLEALRELKHAEWSVMRVLRALENISYGLLEGKTTQPVSRDAQKWVEDHWNDV